MINLNKNQAVTIYLSKLNLDYDLLKEQIAAFSELDDVDCSLYKNESFTNWRFESGAKIEFFNIKPSTLFNIYKHFRLYCGINCIVVDLEWYFGCIVKSELNDGSVKACSNDLQKV